MPKPAAQRLALVDDHPSVRDGLRAYLADWPHGRVVLEAGDGLEYEAACATAGNIHMAVVDLAMPNRDGYATIAWIREHQPETRVLAITFDPTDEAVHGALVAGAHGVLGKTCTRTTFLAAMDELRTTGRVYNELLHRQLTHVPDPGSPLALRKKLLDSLSSRQRTFFRYYMDEKEYSLEEIAKKMDVAPSTVDDHRRELVKKLGVSGRFQTLWLALRFGYFKK